MTNVLRQKSVFFIEWTLEIPQIFCNYEKSEYFRLLNLKCNLWFNCSHVQLKSIRGETNCYLMGSVIPLSSANITFKCDEELNPAVEVFVTFTGNLELHSETHFLKGPHQIIWTWNRDKEPSLLGQLLTIVVFATLPRDDKSVQTPSYIDSSLCLKSITRNLSKLLDEGPNHDVKFICEDQIISAHKNVLCCRSSVFTSMLQSDMLEGNTGQVKIQDMNATIFQQFLRSLYTGMLPELTVDTAVQFYKASDKYAIDTIKEQCADFLVDNLSKENACEILIIADRHDDSDFKKCVMEYIIKEKIPITEEKWADFYRENKDLALEVLNLSFEHFCQN